MSRTGGTCPDYPPLLPHSDLALSPGVARGLELAEQQVLDGNAGWPGRGHQLLLAPVWMAGTHGRRQDRGSPLNDSLCLLLCATFQAASLMPNGRAPNLGPAMTVSWTPVMTQA